MHTQAFELGRELVMAENIYNYIIQLYCVIYSWSKSPQKYGHGIGKYQDR